MEDREGGGKQVCYVSKIPKGECQISAFHTLGDLSSHPGGSPLCCLNPVSPTAAQKGLSVLPLYFILWTPSLSAAPQGTFTY